METSKRLRFVEMKERLFQIFETLGLTVPEIAKASKVPGNTLNQIKGKRSQSMNCDTLSKIIAAYPRINANYVLTGQGEPLLPIGNNPESVALSHLKQTMHNLQEAIDVLTKGH